VELPDDDPEAFGHLVNWVYTDVLDCKLCVFNRTMGERHGDTDKPVHQLQWLKLWILADKLNLSELAEKCLSAHSECLDDSASVVTPEAITLACEQSSDGSELRRHLVKEVAECVLFWHDKYVEGAGVAAAANASFNQQVLEEIQNHLKVGQDGGCNSDRCPMHNRGQGWYRPRGADWG
jgi:hypothetical protein